MSGIHDWVRLNVGGKVFQTTKQTLSVDPESFLARIASADQAIPVVKDRTGAILIDRNPECFGIILDYLRCGELVVDDSVCLDKLARDAAFYGLPHLVAAVKEALRSQYKSNKVVESVTVSNWDPNTVNVHFSNVDPGYVMLEEMKSVRRGLVLTPCGASGNYWIAANNDYFALQKVRDTLESFDFELKEEKGKEWKYRRVVKC
ncbi:BTB/POZ domain-containing protein KCTD17 [Aphelenchoides avenae]|nr:BTB/POZ domain-containing protein KCTD17 [Aphelenchus avenae]